MPNVTVECIVSYFRVYQVYVLDKGHFRKFPQSVRADSK